MDKAFVRYELHGFLQFLRSPVRKQYPFVEHHICFIFKPCNRCPLFHNEKCILKNVVYQNAHEAYDPRCEEISRKEPPFIHNEYFMKRVQKPFNDLAEMIELMLHEIESLDNEVFLDGFIDQLSKKVEQFNKEKICTK